MAGAAFLMRASRRAFATLAVIGGLGWFSACGEGEEPTSMTEVQKCLEAEGLKVLSAGKPPLGDQDAPDAGELITRGAFIAFYSSSDRAEELAPEVRKNAEQARLEVARHGDVTVLHMANAKLDTIESCVEP